MRRSRELASMTHRRPFLVAATAPMRHQVRTVETVTPALAAAVVVSIGGSFLPDTHNYALPHSKCLGGRA